MPHDQTVRQPRLDPAKFRNPAVTAKGEQRAVVALTRLNTLWFNTGSLCNLACRDCYMESGPTNDRLLFLEAAEVAGYLDEVAEAGLPVDGVGFTGGEPFMNKQFPAMLADALERGFGTLTLTNATRPFAMRREALLALKKRHGDRLALRVSIDHHTREKHEQTRGAGSWEAALENVKWLAENRFRLTVAGRSCWGEAGDAARAGYRDLFARLGIPVDAADPAALVLFPELDPAEDVPEVTVNCWDVLGVAPEQMMCASQRMVVKRKGAAGPSVVPCTLLPYDPRFDLGPRLADAARPVALNHPYCARFCVLGGASCSC